MADEEETVLHLTDETPQAAVFTALGAASVCWEHMEGTGQFRSKRAEQIGRELIAHLRLEPPDTTITAAGPDEVETVSVVAAGDRVEILLSVGWWEHGELLAVYSGDGDGDGLLYVLLDGKDRPTNVYERHIVALNRIPKAAT